MLRSAAFRGFAHSKGVMSRSQISHLRTLWHLSRGGDGQTTISESGSTEHHPELVPASSSPQAATRGHDTDTSRAILEGKLGQQYTH